LRSELGDIREFGYFPFGKITTVEQDFLVSGNASISMTIFGSNKFKDVKVFLEKEDTSLWKVISVD